MNNKLIIEKILSKFPLGICALQLTDKQEKYFEIIYVNEMGEKLIGITHKKMIGKLYHEVFPKQYELGITDNYLEALKSQTSISTGNIEYSNGKAFKQIFEIKAIPITDTVLLITYENITELNNILKEKELLLQEVHHRVKNNLQLLVSLFNLNSSNIKNKTILRILNDFKNCIYTLSKVYENLHYKDDFSNVNFDTYIERLCEYFESTLFRDNGIKIEKKLTPVKISGSNAISCGLIINELLTSSYKFSLPKSERNSILISLELNKRNVLLTIEDNGVGFIEASKNKDSDSFGLMMVDALVSQLNGKMDVIKDSGTKFKLTFTDLEKDLN